MNTEPLISIITITFNAEKTLPATLESVASQTCRDYEHIIIDGASTDNTLAIARRSPVARIISEPDNGLYDAMNKGLSMARGKYVIFLNAGDTFVSGETLQYYADAARREPNPDIIYGETCIVDEERTVIGKRHLEVPEVLTVDSFASGMLVCHQAMMVRRDLAPRYDLRYHFSADYDWAIRAMKNGNPAMFVNLHRVTIAYLSEGVTTRNHRASLLERFEIMSHHYGRGRAIARHLGFIPRALLRKLTHNS